MYDGVWDRFLIALAEELPAAEKLREQVHEFPDLSGAEGPTLTRVLAELGVDSWEAVAETGGLVRIGPPTGPAIGIRAELDALPLREETGVAFASRNGAMHACGHDVHIAATVALARAARRVELPVALLLILQPREEAYPSGALDVRQSGLLEPHDLRHVIGAHVHPRVAAGGVAIGGGAVNAASDEFELMVDGLGGHAAYPHHARDPIVAISAIIGAFQSLVSRRIDPMHPAVVTFGSVTAGSAANVIPARATASGSIRTMDPADREFLHAEVGRLAAAVAAGYGCDASVRITRGEPVLVNDPDLAEMVRESLRERGMQVEEPMRSCGADDFSFYAEKFPSVMMFVGTGEGDQSHALHSTRFVPSVRAVGDVAMAFASAVRAAVDVHALESTTAARGRE